MRPKAKTKNGSSNEFAIERVREDKDETTSKLKNSRSNCNEPNANFMEKKALVTKSQQKAPNSLKAHSKNNTKEGGNKGGGVYKTNI